MNYSRFIVCGDSFSEGMNDEIVDGKYRGWADRVADVMAANTPGFTYVNLAVRGKLVRQVINDQVPVALSFITGKETLISFHAGVNDALRPNYKAELLLPEYSRAVREIAATGATVMLFTVLERSGNTGKGADIWAARFTEFNRNIRAIGKEVGAIVIDATEESFLGDPRLLAFDRLHLNPLGHDRVAQGVLEKLGLPFDQDWRKPLPHAKPTPWIKNKLIGFLWFVTFALPWIWRRIRGRSSGDGRSGKYEAPVAWPTTSK
jgi:lysophospholipase L1-like esterase